MGDSFGDLGAEPPAAEGHLVSGGEAPSRCRLGVFEDNIVERQHSTKISLKDSTDIEIFISLEAIVKECWQTKADNRPSISDVKDQLQVVPQEKVQNKKPETKLWITTIGTYTWVGILTVIVALLVLSY